MFRVKKAPNEKYLYALDRRDARVVRRVGLLGTICTVFIFLGYLQFVHISPLVAGALGPVLVVILLYHFTEYLPLLGYPGFDIRRHNQRVHDYWRSKVDDRKSIPKVAVFIPAAGEAVEIVAATARAAAEIDYPRFRVFILDDSKDGIYEKTAADLGVLYIHRDNPGHEKKAGNMNNALAQIPGCDRILVLDADFVPRPEILRELVPYAAADVGIVQSPQHFALNAEAHARSKVEYGAAYIQRDFYRITQVARNRFGSAICVGTSALYSVDALQRVKGFEGVGQPRGWAHSEDVHTGLKMLHAYNSFDQRYKIVYVPIQLAKGACPDTHHSFYKQQNRWATGSIQLMLSGKTIWSDKLTFLQRIIYGSNSLYYLYTVSMLLSPLYLLILALNNQPASWAFTLYFMPSLVFKFLIEPYVLRRQHAPLATSIVVISNAYTFVQAFFLLLIRRPLGWEATGTKSKKKSRHFTVFKMMALIGFTSLYITTLGALILNERFQFGPSMFIVMLFLTSLLAHLVFLFYTLIVSSETKRRLLDRKFYASVFVLVLLVGVVFESYTYHRTYNVIVADDRIRFVKQTERAQPAGTVLDGYRRSAGDVKQLLKF